MVSHQRRLLNAPQSRIKTHLYNTVALHYIAGQR